MLDPSEFGKVQILYEDVPLDIASLAIEPESGLFAIRAKGVSLTAHLTAPQAMAIAIAMALSAESAGVDLAAALRMLSPATRDTLIGWKRQVREQAVALGEAAGHA